MPNTECIHGFEAGLCDSCFPKPVPEKPAVVAKTRVPRSATTRRAAGAPRKVVDPDAQRVHLVVDLEAFDVLLDAGNLGDAHFFASPDEEGWRQLRSAANVLDQVVLVSTKGAVKDATPVPFEAVQLVAVANTVAQERVRELLAITSFRTRVSIYPPWFQG